MSQSPLQTRVEKHLHAIYSDSTDSELKPLA